MNEAAALRILVVEDHGLLRAQIVALLRDAGHIVEEASDGRLGLQMALEQPPDVLVLDLGLPGLDGYEVAKRIRQDPMLKHVVLVALTGYDQELDRETSEQAGFNHHLVKPARFAQLQKILATVAVADEFMLTDSVPPERRESFCGGPLF